MVPESASDSDSSDASSSSDNDLADFEWDDHDFSVAIPTVASDTTSVGLSQWLYLPSGWGCQWWPDFDAMLNPTLRRGGYLPVLLHWDLAVCALLCKVMCLFLIFRPYSLLGGSTMALGARHGNVGAGFTAWGQELMLIMCNGACSIPCFVSSMAIQSRSQHAHHVVWPPIFPVCGVCVALGPSPTSFGPHRIRCHRRPPPPGGGP
jgi:hypothetical protein